MSYAILAGVDQLFGPVLHFAYLDWLRPLRSKLAIRWSGFCSGSPIEGQHMKRTHTHASRKLGLKRETVRALSSLGPDQLAQVAGGSGYVVTHPSVSGGSKYC